MYDSEKVRKPFGHPHVYLQALPLFCSSGLCMSQNAAPMTDWMLEER